MGGTAGQASRDVIFYFNGTFMQRSNGAHSRAEACLNFLLRNADRVIVYSFRNHPTCPWTDDLVAQFGRDYPGVELVLDHRSRLLVTMTRLKNLAAVLLPAWAKPILTLRAPGAAPGYAALLRRHSAAVLVVNYVDGLTQLNGLGGRRVVVETHDIKFINYRMQTHQPASSLRTVLKFRSEVGLLDTVEAAVAISPTEANVFRMLIDQDKVLYIPEYGRAPSTDATVGDAADFLYDLVFVGSDNILNVDGLTGFLHAHADWLGRYRMAVCGRVCAHDAVTRLADRNPNITLLGFVNDLAEVYRRSKAAVSPVTGTGLKIKIVDALERGKPVFASPTSFAGLPPGYQDCVFPIARDGMRKLLDDGAERRAAERASRAYFAEFSRVGDRDRLITLVRSAAAAGADAVIDTPPREIRTINPA